MADILTHFHFLRPYWILLLIPAVLIYYWRHINNSESDSFSKIIAPHLLQHLRMPAKPSSWLNPRSFAAVVFTLFILILMGPSWKQQPSPLSQDQAALVVLLDVSQSMSQSDVQPSRLERAKQKVCETLP